MRNYRPFAFLGLFLSLVLLASVFVWILVRFGTPQQVLVYAGEAKDYLPGQVPRLVFSENGGSFYVLNLEREFIALSATSKVHSIRCLVHWQASMNAFVDPCLGTHFSPGGPPPGVSAAWGAAPAAGPGAGWPHVGEPGIQIREVYWVNP